MDLSGSAPADSATRRHGRSTLADVAALSGVASMTVSRYLRAPQSVSAKTAHKIQAALSQIAYTPNKQAGLLASGRSQIVAAIIPNLGNSIFAETVQGISDTLRGSGLELLLASTNYSLEREEEQIRAVLGWAPAALIVTGRTHSAGALALMRQAKAGGTPVVEMWDKTPPHAADVLANGRVDASADRGAKERANAQADAFEQIGFNHFAVGQRMAQHLLGRGYRHLGYVDSAVAQDFRAHERCEGFAQAVQAAGAQVQVIRADISDEPLRAGRQALRVLVRAGQSLPRALAFANDHLCAGAWLEASERGIRVPQDLALLGFGDFALSRELGLNTSTGQRGLSTVQVQRGSIGVHSARAVLRALGLPMLGSAGHAATTEIVPMLVQRATD